MLKWQPCHISEFQKTWSLFLLLFYEGKTGFSYKAKNLKANIWVNGFTTESINIEQAVKQGDALSCSLFILCIDPLIRKVNGYNKIEGLNIGINGDSIDKLCIHSMFCVLHFHYLTFLNYSNIFTFTKVLILTRWK